MQKKYHFFSAELAYWRLKSGFRKLSRDEKAFVRSGNLVSARTSTHWKHYFERLMKLDVMGTSIRKHYKLRFGLSWVALFFSLFIAVFTVSWIPIQVALVLVIYFSFRFFGSKRADIPNIVRESLLKMTQLLSLESSRLKFNLDIDTRLKKRKFIKEDKSVKKTRLRYYDINWFGVRCNLRDGSKLNVQFRDIICQRRRTKVSSSGKYKTKTKHKSKCYQTYILSFSEKLYQLNDKQPADMQSSVQDGVITVKYKRVVKSAGINRRINVEEMASMISSIYQCVTPEEIAA